MVQKLHIYCRVSTTEQKESGTSLETQKEIGIELSKKLTKGKYEMWDEGSQSSFKDDLVNRPILTKLLVEVDKGNVSQLYVWNTDRLSRNQKVWGLIRYKLKQHNVLLYVGSDPNPIDLSDPMDNLLVGILSEISQYDNYVRMERFRLGKIERVKNGQWFGGSPPFGYQIVDKRLKVHPYEMKWVKTIFENYVKGDSIDKIRNDLFVNGVKSRRGLINWNNGTIEKIFQNTHFEGWYEFKDKKSGQKFKCECPTEIPITLLNKVRKLREERSYRRGKGRMMGGNSKRDYLLKGLLECGYCGSRFGGRTVPSQYIEHYYCIRKETNYRDKRTYKYKECKKGRRSLKVEICDDVIWNKVIDVCENSFLFKEKEKLEILEKSNFDVDTKQIKKLESRIVSFDRELKNIEKNIIQLESDRILNKRTDKEVEGILKNVNLHRNQIIENKENTKGLIDGSKKDLQWVDWVKEFSSKIKTIRKERDLEIRKKFLNGIIDRIIVNYVDGNTHNLRVFFRIPYINDELIWKDETDKKKGYDIKKGLKSLYINYDEDNLKKKLMNG